MSTELKRNRLVTILIMIVLLLAVLACGQSATPTKVGEVATSEPTEAKTTEETRPPELATIEEATEEPTPEGPTTYQVGDIVNIGDTAMVVLGWAIPEADDFNKPDEGKQFVAVELLFVNQGSDTDSISSMLQMGLKDDSDQTYDVDLMASAAADSSAPDGEIGPGERVRGKVGFQVPEDAQGLVFVFDADVFGTGKVFVELGAEPIALEPPTEIAGEQAIDTYNVGDIIEIGDLVMTVNEVTYPAGDDFNKPDQDRKFVVVDVTFENKAAEAKSISSMLQMELKDATGQKYDVDLMASAAAGGSTPDGEIAPGERVRGKVGYQVPENAEGLMFVFDADVFGHGKVFVTLP